jgi:hypothetical protein
MALLGSLDVADALEEIVRIHVLVVRGDPVSFSCDGC